MGSKAMRYDRMVRDRKDDELGLFEKYDEVLEEIRGMINAAGDDNVLDIGCGTGNLCGCLDGGINVVGMDQSPDMLKEAKIKYGNMKLRLGNFLDEPYCRGFFDTVVTTFAFHILRDEEKKLALNNMLGFLKDNGRIIIGDYMFRNSKEREQCREQLLGQQKNDLWEVIESRYYINIESFTEHVLSLGLKISFKHIVNFTWLAVIEKTGAPGA
ncbi:MAG: class I SAM-dependent methyltransferase [Pseudomonadota bacterium]